LSEKATDAVVQAVADLFVNYLTQNPDPGVAAPEQTLTTGAVAPKKETHA